VLVAVPIPISDAETLLAPARLPSGHRVLYHDPRSVPESRAGGPPSRCTRGAIKLPVRE